MADSVGARIAYVCADPGVPVFGSKGASVHVQEVVAALVGLGATVELFASSLSGARPRGMEGVETHEIANWPREDREGMLPPVAGANRSLEAGLGARGPFDFVYERYSLWSYGAMEYARSQGVPGLLEFNAPLVEEAARYRGLKNRATGERVTRRVLDAASVVLAVSGGVAKYLADFPQASGKVHVVPNGVNGARFPADLRPSRPGRRGTFTVGFVGSLKPWHGVAALADAYGELKARIGPTRLLVVGDGPERAGLEEKVASMGLSDSCELTGAVPPSEVPGLIASMDVGVAPYPDLEGFYFSPLKVLEYMAAGKPVVASRVGDLPAVVRDGVDGFLVRPGDPRGLAEALFRLGSDEALREAMGTAGRSRAQGSLTWDGVARKILDLAGAQPSPGGRQGT